MIARSHIAERSSRIIASAPARLCFELIEDESGQDMVEYALVAALVGLGTVTGIHGIAAQIANYVDVINANFTNSIPGH